MNTLTKKGRPTAYHRLPNGDRVEGLSKLADGRWKISPFPGQPTAIKFTEADEWLAVSHFRKVKAKIDKQARDYVEVPFGKAATADDAVPLIAAATKKQRIVIRIPKDHTKGISVSRSFESDELWAWLRQQVLTRPKWVAEKIGIEQVGYLTDLKPPTASVKLSALIDAYAGKPKLSTNEASRSRLFWAEFMRAVKVEVVRDIGHEQIVAYEKSVLAAGRQSKSVHHRFAKIKTIISYALKRGMDTDGCRKALDAAAMLDAQHRNQNDPTPITPEEFWRVYNAAMKADDKVFAALLITSLNAAMYGGEAAALKWSEIDLTAGTLVCRRPKTGVSRVCCLWPATIAALKVVPKEDTTDDIFHTTRRSFTTFSVLAVWRRYCDAAGLPNDLKFGAIRDAAYSIACQSASLDQAKALAGHRFPGMADAYVRRRPDFVAAACEAIGDEFEVSKHAK